MDKIFVKMDNNIDINIHSKNIANKGLMTEIKKGNR